MLLYGDSPFQFHLEKLVIEECTQCKTDNDLKNIIFKDNPGLRSLLKKNTLEAAKTILNWSANHILFASDREALGDTSGWSASNIYYNMFDKQTSGVYCGGAADFLAKVYHLFNINAFTIDVGILKGNLTHVTTVVALEKKNVVKYYIFDPTFNLIFYDKKNQFASIDQLAEAAEDSTHFDDLIRFKMGRLFNRGYISSNTTLPSTLMNILTHHQHGNIVFYRCEPNLFKRYLKVNHTYLKKYGFTPNNSIIIQFMQRNLFSLSGTMESETQINFLNYYKQKFPSVVVSKQLNSASAQSEIK